MGFTSEIINTDINACTDYSQSKSQMNVQCCYISSWNNSISIKNDAKKQFKQLRNKTHSILP